MTNEYVNLIIWILGFSVLIQMFKNDLFGLSAHFNHKLIGVPMDIKCAFQENMCEDGDIDTWSIIYFVAYSIIGYNYPNQYLVVLFISILVEIVSMWMGYPSRMIMNPLISITGYGVGSAFNRR